MALVTFPQYDYDSNKNSDITVKEMKTTMNMSPTDND